MADPTVRDHRTQPHVVVRDHRQSSIEHVFVLMLENRSFDHLLGFSGIAGTDAATGAPTKINGLTGAALALEPPLGFWTFTVWADEKSMRAFRNSDPHMKAMPRLLQWCDGASYAHWLQDDTSVPTAVVAFERLRDSGKLSKVNHPSAAHAAGRTTEDAEPRAALPLRPRRA